MTPETKGILNKANMKKLPAGSYIINAARGAHLIELDLLELIDAGHIAGAALDVFETEPLHLTSQLWSNPKVAITPHVAAVADHESAAKVIAETVKQIKSDKPILNSVNLTTGY